MIQRLYQYDKTGQLTGIQDTRRGNINYKYDPVGRLLEANSKLGKETFSFDPASNIIDRYNTNKEQSHQQTAEEKGYGYNRLVNNVVKEYLDQQYQYDAYGQLIRQKSTKGDLHLEWDVCGRLIKSRNAEYTAEYRYDALGRRIQKRSKHHHTGDEQNVIYGWEGNTLAYESNDQVTKHYVYEKGSFVPLLQAVYTEAIGLHQTPDWSDTPYSLQRDPLWKINQKATEWNDIGFYHCDHLGTPQEMTDHTGVIIWRANYLAWGKCKTEKAKSSFFENSEILSNNIRFQGQYFDQETGLHYNRYRYYSPYVGRFISKDPIGLLGGHNVYAYAPNPVEWIDPLGLEKKLCSICNDGSSGRSNRQEVIKALANDPLQPKHVRGWVKNELRHIETGNRKTVRLPGNSRNSRSKGFELAHGRTTEAKDGYCYRHSQLQNADLHKSQHKIGGY
ncbi:RHS repeat-associated protein [Acinetobacter sp. BIGb0196]|nr:RHS repeat-associated protein [Acinetobacter guillouiae]MCW2251298.1 RHS repeat-associated protein [Acinetobacter sp. BIGb0204]NII36204.1 RHS repeat-associated protein [Acinetobacter sp. BIGb0196]